MINRIFSPLRFYTTLGALTLSINVLLLIGYLFSGYEEHLHSDSAVRLLLAEEVIRTGELLPSTWHFVNGDLSLLSAHWFALPIVAVAPVSPFAHAVAGLVSASVLALAFLSLLVALKTSLPSRIWLMAVIFSGVSGLIAEGLFGQASYSMFCTATLMLLAAVICILEEEQPAGRVLIFVACAIALQVASNPLRSLVFCLFPLALALHFSYWKFCSEDGLPQGNLSAEPHSVSVTKYRGLVGMMLVGVFSGLIIRTMLTQELLQIPGVMSDLLRTSSLQEVSSNFSVLVKGLLASLGSRPSAGPALSPEGMYHLFRLALAGIAVSLAVSAVLRGLADNRRSRVFFSVFAASSFLLPAFVCIGTNLLALSPDIEGIRYLLPGTVLLLILIVIDSLDWFNSPVRATLSLCLVVGFAVSAYFNLFMVDVSSKWTSQERDAYASQTRELVAILRERGLQYGYGSYWLANSTTVQSADTVKMRPILFESGLPVPRLWLSSSHWYSPSAWSGESFLALTNEEAQLVDQDRLEKEGLKPNAVIREQGFEIWIFPVNLAAKLAWGSQPQ